jgi:hypothetical protein
VERIHGKISWSTALNCKLVLGERGDQTKVPDPFNQTKVPDPFNLTPLIRVVYKL